MLEVLKKSMSILDALILAVAAYIFMTLDYDNLRISDKIYMAGFGLWVAMLAVRIYIVYRNGGDKND